MAIGIYGAKAGVGVTSRFVENRISKPSLIRETSRLTFSDIVKDPKKVRNCDLVGTLKGC